ncbi:MAG: cytochrome c5 family protein [Bdellovibrio sp.]|nr:cytochrome c5 family protein [Methylotenera sp.]
MDNHDEHASPSTLQPMVIIFGIILAIGVVASLIFGKPVVDDAVPAVAAVAENIKPVAVVEVAAPVTEHVAKSGAEVVKGGCAMCHAAGLMNAPKIGDKGQWAPRIALGYETLVSHAVNGIRSMPAKGGNPDLSEEEIAAAVAEMANQAGATFDSAKFVKAKAS